MPRQNRVLPTAEITAHPARGLFMGNRGCLHDANGQLGRARWRHKAWICCVLSFKGRRRPIMAPNRYTELFFLDEAVALAAGHRPCAECRRADYNRFRTAWETAFGQRLKAPKMDAVLHDARIKTGENACECAGPSALPHGSFVRHHGDSLLLTDHGAFRYTPEGYAPVPHPKGPVSVLTPAPIIGVLRAGYRPVLHPTAD